MDLENRLGTIFSFTCKKCGSPNEYHVNEVNARVNKEFILVSGIIIMVVAGLFIMTFSGILMCLFFLVALPTILSIARGEAMLKREHLFNKYKVSEGKNYKPRKPQNH